MAINELNAQVRRLRRLKHKAEELEAEIEAIQNSLKATMTEENTDELSGPDWRITWKIVFGSRFDSTAFKKAQPDLYAAFAKPTETRRFCLN